MVEQRTENPRVAGSIPALGIFYGILAQSVEHLTFNQVVRGSNPRTLIVRGRENVEKIKVFSIFMSAYFFQMISSKRFFSTSVNCVIGHEEINSTDLIIGL